VVVRKRARLDEPRRIGRVPVALDALPLLVDAGQNWKLLRKFLVAVISIAW
jgi:hypothetical protein